MDDVLDSYERGTCVYSRFFCFITNCKFFSVFDKIICRFIDKINIVGRPQTFEFEVRIHLTVVSNERIVRGAFKDFVDKKCRRESICKF